jgi:hypothetical protein
MVLPHIVNRRSQGSREEDLPILLFKLDHFFFLPLFPFFLLHEFFEPIRNLLHVQPGKFSFDSLPDPSY